MPLRVVSLRRQGRVIPRRTDGMRAAVIALKPNAVMDWHSTGPREELLIVLAGRVQVHTAKAPPKQRKEERKNRKEKIFASFAKFRVFCGTGFCDVAVIRAGQCAFLPVKTWHRIVNRSERKARYLYVTAAAA